jgi:hypothetical protein
MPMVSGWHGDVSFPVVQAEVCDCRSAADTSKSAQRVLPSSRVAVVRRVGWNCTDEDQLQMGHIYLAPLPFGSAAVYIIDHLSYRVDY